MTTKEKICSAAKTLFNEKGYSNVTLREIADAAGTTIGNLTYHFPQKEILLNEIHLDLHTRSRTWAPLREGDDPMDVLEDLIESFFRAESSHTDNIFYFRNLLFLCRDSEDMDRENCRFRKLLYDHYTEVFAVLRGAGILSEMFDEDQYAFLAQASVSIASLWMHDHTIFTDEDIPAIPLGTALCDQLLPYITEETRPRYLQLVEWYRHRIDRERRRSETTE